jgi:hypothetical protein
MSLSPFKDVEEGIQTKRYYLMYTIERLVIRDPRFCRIAWSDLVYDMKRTLNASNIDLMDFPHLIRNPLHMNVNVNDSIVPAIL